MDPPNFARHGAATPAPRRQLPPIWKPATVRSVPSTTTHQPAGNRPKPLRTPDNVEQNVEHGGDFRALCYGNITFRAGDSHTHYRRFCPTFPRAGTGYQDLHFMPVRRKREALDCLQ